MVLPNPINDRVVGFDEDVEEETGPKKTSTKKLGGFYRLCLHPSVLKGVQKRGYKTPTPIQRKAIPLIKEGRDVVAMARTGSGKTACFLIPLFERLLAKPSKHSIKALILSPTRELALQTMKFVKELGRFCGVRAAAVLGGDSMDSQFSVVHSKPDVVVATPGRFLHLCVEMDLKLSEVEYVVFDEADRLFEMGFGEQLREIIHRLPDSRQTLLFSATLPKVLVEFARAGLTDPVLLRLDVESKLPETLELSFVSCRSDEKPAALLCLLDHVIPADGQVAIFVATKHHVEYVHMLLDQAGVSNTFVYSDLDPSARKINTAKFQTGKVRALVVTDVAARGLDIPWLDFVINYNFPAKAKLFVHRVGRCARAGRAGTAHSLVSGDELCYLLDLCLFLGRSLACVGSDDAASAPDALGRIPQHMLDEQLSKILLWHDTHSGLMVLPNPINDRVVGFDEDVEEETGPKKTSTKKLGGFYRLCLHPSVLKGVQKRGYKTPTPIQRKAIPLIKEGRDVVAMARTGSGKTACFLIPLFERLLAKPSKHSIKALILSPTRELALQTMKFVKELGRFCGVRAAAVLGGDSMDSQFSVVHSKPDVVVATPGRFLHLCVEMDLKLSEVEYVVFDEADRLFEMGFGEQLREIIHRLPDSRQTLLFSATLPKVLVEFARAGLTDPVLLRLDVESKLPETLELSFVSCRSDEKPAALLCLLDHVIPADGQVAIFVATKHHVEYVHMLLDQAGVSNTFVYSDLDPSARKINTAKFQTGKVRALVVTDVAARGLDIPWLDFVINYNFPAKAKLFVHRVGRCARAGRAGTAHSLVSGDELCYLLDLCLFLGRSLACVGSDDAASAPDALGRIPQHMLDEQLSKILLWHDTHSGLTGQRRVSENAYKQYLRSRPGASVDSVRRVKELPIATLGTHPAFVSVSKPQLDRASLLAQMKNYKPQGTVFEFGQSSHVQSYNVMKTKRTKDNEKIFRFKQKIKQKNVTSEGEEKKKVQLESSSVADISRTFSRVILPAKRREVRSKAGGGGKRAKMGGLDTENFIPYKPADTHTEQGLAVENFQQTADRAMLDLTGDTDKALRQGSNRTKMVWDKKRKKMVGVETNSKVGKIKSESGTWIPATYKSGRYKAWVEKNKTGEDESDDDDQDKEKSANLKTNPNTRWGRHNLKVQQKAKLKLKNADQILKQRMIAERNKKKNARKKSKKKK